MGLFKKKKTVKSQGELRQMLLTRIIGNNPIVLYDYNREDFISKGYSSNAEVYAIIKKMTDKCNVATPYLYIDNKAVKGAKYLTTQKAKNSILNVCKHRLEVHKALDYAPEDNDLTKLLKRPNSLQTWREFITLFRIFYFVQGEAFMYRYAGKNNCAMSLHIVPAHSMQAIIDGGVLVGWKYDRMDGHVRNFAAEDVLHFKMPNPTFNNNYSQYRGMSPLMAGLKYLQLDDKAVIGWIKSIENEGAKGIVSPNHPNPELWLTESQVTDVQEQIELKIHGSENRNKISVSGMPLQYTHIGLSPEALSIIEGLKYANVKLCDLWGVPSVLFDANPTYQNQKEAGKRFLLDVVLPYLNSEEDKLNSWLVQPFNIRDSKNYVIDYDLSAYEELRLDISAVDAMLKTHSINEVRVMQGSDEREEPYANEVMIPQGMVPLSDYNVTDIEV